MINSIEKECIGCGACYNICPQNAITMEYDSEGFLYPKIDKTKCINCGLCEKKCPILKKICNENEIETYAYYTKDEDLRYNSSSGGIFSALALYVINKLKGVVVGAAFDENNYCKHIIVDNEKDLEKLRGSKYVQSDITECLKEIREIIKSRVVLFSGTPCQIAAINSLIGKNQNLYTVDIFCHGVPAPKIFEKYLQEIEAKKSANIKFKDKRNGWNNSLCSYQTENGEYIANHDQDRYYLGFIENLYLRKSCYSCKFNQYNKRPADISIGDFWECEDLYPELNDNKGVSAVIINSSKGKQLYNSIQNRNCYSKAININDIIRGNIVIQKPSILTELRKDFYSYYKKTNKVIESIEKTLSINKNVAIMNHSFTSDNYGAILVSYSMEKIVEKLGYIPHTIGLRGQSNTNFDAFKNKHLHLTKKFKLSIDFSILNKYYGTFIVGSDQVWRNWWNNDQKLYKWFFNFADYSKNLIAYAASFGKDYFEDTNCSKRHISELLKGFSAISVRERSGIEICKKDFNANAKLVIDPTQLLEAEDYNKIIEADSIENKPEKPYLTYMIFPEDNLDNDNTYNFIKDIAKQLELEVKPLLGSDLKIAEWLNTIKNSSFVVTESFHGTMFSIIYKKPFLCIAPDNSTRNRLGSFFEKIGCLQDRIIYNFDEKKAKDIINTPIDYTEVYKRRKLFKDESLTFLKDALNSRIINNGRIITKEKFIFKKIISPFKTKIYIFKYIPIMKIKKKNNRNIYFLFGVIPILKLKERMK